MIDRVGTALTPDPLQQLIYVADSALITGPHRARLAAANRRVISRCPETFRVTREAKAAAWAAATWEAVGAVADRAAAAESWASEQTGRIDDRLYRLVIYRSTHPDLRREQALDREIPQHRQALEQAAKRLTDYEFLREADAPQALDHWFATTPHPGHAVQGPGHATIHHHRHAKTPVRTTRPQRGMSRSR